MLVSQGRRLQHDEGGVLQAMQINARAKVFGAQFLRPADPSNPAYCAAIEEAIDITAGEMLGWLEIRTEAMPAGDLEGAGSAALALSSFYMELDLFGGALFSLVTARRHFRHMHCYAVENNIDFVMLHVEDAFEMDLLRCAFVCWVEQRSDTAQSVCRIIDFFKDISLA
jgi:hypothetical protein